MEENQSPEVEKASRPASSLGSRLMDILVAPGEVFDSIKAGPPFTANWLVPILIICLVGIASVFVSFSQPAVIQQMRDQQTKRFDRMVETGKMTAAQAEASQAQLERFMGPGFLKAAGSVAAIVGSFGWLFFLALVLWLLGTRLFKGQFSFQQAVEATALTGMIGVVGAIITTLLVVATGNLMMTPGPALLIREFDPANKIHLALAAINVITIWYIAVLALGLAKLSGAAYVQAAAWLFIPWLVIKLGIVFSGLGHS
ncbi:MAG: YIP1 family protein [Candidatus Omnitrophica bacterium]|nr:YIP1 family protein [Candidatus Omnitrophota bacterium]